MNDFLLWFVLIMIAGLIVASILYMKSKQIRMENYYLLLQKQMIEDHYQTLNDQVKLERKFQHDVKNYIQTLEALMSMSEENPIIHRQYEKDIAAFQKDYIIEDWTKNPVIDTVLHNKLSMCRELKIQVSLNVRPMKLEAYEKIPLLTVLYNLFDNAIEGCQSVVDLEKRYLKIQLKEDGKYFTMKFENSKAASHKTKSGEKTSKIDKRNHGMGLEIMRETAELCGGGMEIHEEENRYCTSVWLGKKK